MFLICFCNWQLLWNKEHQVQLQAYFGTANSLEEHIKSLKSHYCPRICETRLLFLSHHLNHVDWFSCPETPRRRRKPQIGQRFPDHSTTASWCQTSKVASWLWRSELHIHIPAEICLFAIHLLQCDVWRPKGQAVVVSSGLSVKCKIWRTSSLQHNWFYTVYYIFSYSKLSYTQSDCFCFPSSLSNCSLLLISACWRV